MYSLSSSLRRAAAAEPGRVALRCDGRSMSWPEVLKRVSRFAAVLEESGVCDGCRVGILAANSDSHLIGMYAVSWAGGIFVPINTRFADQEMRYCVEDAGCRVLLADGSLAGVAENMHESCPTVETVIRIDTGAGPSGLGSFDELIGGAQPRQASGRGGDDVAALYYTGGTTGRSKGVMLTHHGILTSILQWSNAIGLSSRDTLLIVAPMFHLVGGLNAIAATTLAAGMCIVGRFHVPAVLKEIEAARVTKAAVVPIMVDMMIDQLASTGADISSLEKISYGGAPMTEAALRRAIAALPYTRFYQVYGQTEGGPNVSVLGPEYHVLEGANAGKLRSAGKPLPGTELAILDPEDRPLPQGHTGEIGVRGISVSPGYWNLPEVTEQANRGGWLHTGDVGYIDAEGFLFIVDRIRDMIITGGENVYSAEVENVLSDHPAVSECVVIGIPSKKWGEAVHAVVRLFDDAAVTADELIAFCKERLAGYKCPRSLEFRTEPFPLSGANKVLKRKLRAPYWDADERKI